MTTGGYNFAPDLYNYMVKSEDWPS